MSFLAVQVIRGVRVPAVTHAVPWFLTCITCKALTCCSIPPSPCSYNGMGLARADCQSGCTCEPQLLDGLWDQRVSLQQMHTFQARELGCGSGCAPCLWVELMWSAPGS